MSTTFQRKIPRNVSRVIGKKSKEVLAFISAYKADHDGLSPSYVEIGDAVQVKSSSTVHRHVGKLIEHGHLRHKAKSPRNLELTVPGKAKLPDDVLDILLRWSKFGERHYLVGNTSAETGFGELLWSTMSLLDQHATADVMV